MLFPACRSWGAREEGGVGKHAPQVPLDKGTREGMVSELSTVPNSHHPVRRRCLHPPPPVQVRDETGRPRAYHKSQVLESWVVPQTVSQQAPSERRCERKANTSPSAETAPPQTATALLEGCATKAADCQDRRLGTDSSPRAGNTRGLGPVTPATRTDDTVASDPTSQEVQLLRTTKQNKGARRGRSRRAFQSRLAADPEPALPRLVAPFSAGRGPRPGQPPLPCLPAAARDRSRGSSRRAARDGKTRWLLPASLLLHPSLREPAAWPPSAGPWGGRGPGSSGLTPGKGLPLSKGHHPSAVPGLGLVPPIPRPRGRRWGAAPSLGR